MKKQNKSPRFGLNTVRNSTLDEWMNLWFQINVLPWKDENPKKVFMDQAKEFINNFYKQEGESNGEKN